MDRSGKYTFNIVPFVDFQENCFCIRVSNDNKVMLERHYKREGQQDLAYNMTFAEYMAFERNDAKIRISRKLSHFERQKLHEIFPFIYDYHGLVDFARMIEEHQDYNYEVYDNIADICEVILADDQYECSKRWIYMNTEDTSVLVLKWEQNGKKHILAVNNDLYYSDASIVSIIRSERRGLFGGVDTTDALKYADAMKDAALPSYINNGGRMIISYLTAHVLDHPFELAAKIPGLHLLADEMHLYKGINRRGTNLAEVLGLPFKIIKRIVEDGETQLLMTQEDRKILAWIFRKDSSVLQTGFDELVILYGSYVYENQEMLLPNGKRLGDVFAQTLHYLQRIKKEEDPYILFVKYMRYIENSCQLNYFRGGMFPENLLRTLEIVEELLHMDDQDYQFMLDERRKHFGRYEYTDSNFKLVIPRKPQTLIDAGEKLHNCLIYFNSILQDDENMVLLLICQKKREGNELMGAVSIWGDQMIEVKGYCNKKVNPVIAQWIIDYAKKKDIKIRCDHDLMCA